MELKLKALSPKLGKDIPFPSYATAGSAGMEKPLSLSVGKQVLPLAGTLARVVFDDAVFRDHQGEPAVDAQPFPRQLRGGH